MKATDPAAHPPAVTASVAASVSEWARRLRCVAVPESSHNREKTIPPSLYDEHPEWFVEIDGKRVPPSGTCKLEHGRRLHQQGAAGRSRARRAAVAWLSLDATRPLAVAPADSLR